MQNWVSVIIYHDSAPTELNVEFDSNIKTISCGMSHTIVLLESGKCYGWGGNGI